MLIRQNSADVSGKRAACIASGVALGSPRSWRACRCRISDGCGGRGSTEQVPEENGSGDAIGGAQDCPVQLHILCGACAVVGDGDLSLIVTCVELGKFGRGRQLNGARIRDSDHAVDIAVSGGNGSGPVDAASAEGVGTDDALKRKGLRVGVVRGGYREG